MRVAMPEHATQFCFNGFDPPPPRHAVIHLTAPQHNATRQSATLQHGPRTRMRESHTRLLITSVLSGVTGCRRLRLCLRVCVTAASASQPQQTTRKPAAHTSTAPRTLVLVQRNDRIRLCSSRNQFVFAVGSASAHPSPSRAVGQLLANTRHNRSTAATSASAEAPHPSPRTPHLTWCHACCAEDGLAETHFWRRGLDVASSTAADGGGAQASVTGCWMQTASVSATSAVGGTVAAPCGGGGVRPSFLSPRPFGAQRAAGSGLSATM